MYKRCGCKILYDFHLMQNYAKIHILLAFSEYNLIDQRDTSLKIFINEVSTSKIPGECPIRGKLMFCSYSFHPFLSYI